MRWTAIVLVLLMVLLVLVPSGLSKTLQIKDMSGRRLEVPFDPQRIICLGPGTLRLIVYLQAKDKVVGVEELEKRFPHGRPYWLASPKLHDLPLCGPGGPASINQKPEMETVLNLDPDVIFVTYMNAALADEVQETLNIPVVVLSYGTFANFDDTVFKALKIAGRVLNRKKRASEVAGFIRGTANKLQKRSQKSEKTGQQGVYVGGIGYRGAQGIGSTMREYAPFDWINAHNLVRDLEASSKTHLSLNKETLLKINPDIIFIDGGGLSLVARDYSRKAYVYNALQAFRQKKVYILHPFNWYTTNLGTVLTDAYAVGKKLYPKAFKDIELKKKADQIYNFLVNMSVYDMMQKHYGELGSNPKFLQ